MRPRDHSLSRFHLRDPRSGAGPVDTEARLFRLLGALQLVLLPLAMLAYGERYSLLSNAISDLGTLRTPAGETNGLSVLLFATDLTATSVVLCSYAVHIRRKSGIGHPALKADFAWIGAAGALLALAPHDAHRLVHGIGAGMLVGSLWMLANLLALELRDQEPAAARRIELVLQATVLPYATAFFIDADAKQLLQKLAVLGLVWSLRAVFRARKHGAAARKPSGLAESAHATISRRRAEVRR